MRKLMVLAAMLAMMLAAAAPAMAQDAAGASDEGDVTVTGGDVFIVDASQETAVAVSNIQNGDAAAAADDGSIATASATATSDITINQVNAGVGDDFFDDNDDFFVDEFGFVVFF